MGFGGGGGGLDFLAGGGGGGGKGGSGFDPTGGLFGGGGGGFDPTGGLFSGAGFDPTSLFSGYNNPLSGFGMGTGGTYPTAPQVTSTGDVTTQAADPNQQLGTPQQQDGGAKTIWPPSPTEKGYTPPPISSNLPPSDPSTWKAQGPTGFEPRTGYYQTPEGVAADKDIMRQSGFDPKTGMQLPPPTDPTTGQPIYSSPGIHTLPDATTDGTTPRVSQPLGGSPPASTPGVHILDAPDPGSQSKPNLPDTPETLTATDWGTAPATTAADPYGGTAPGIDPTGTAPGTPGEPSPETTGAAPAAGGTPDTTGAGTPPTGAPPGTAAPPGAAPQQPATLPGIINQLLGNTPLGHIVQQVLPMLLGGGRWHPEMGGLPLGMPGYLPGMGPGPGIFNQPFRPVPGQPGYPWGPQPFRSPYGPAGAPMPRARPPEAGLTPPMPHRVPSGGPLPPGQGMAPAPGAAQPGTVAGQAAPGAGEGGVQWTPQGARVSGQPPLIQGGNAQLHSDRAKFAQELQRNPALLERVLRIGWNEQEHGEGSKGIFESMMNRASVNGRSLDQESRWHSGGQGYYQMGSMGRGSLESPRSRQVLMNSLNAALGGSNVTNYATDNSSDPLSGRQPYYATNQERRGDFVLTRNINGEHFQTPGLRQGNYWRWQRWAREMGNNAIAATQPWQTGLAF